MLSLGLLELQSFPQEGNQGAWDDPCTRFGPKHGPFPKAADESAHVQTLPEYLLLRLMPLITGMIPALQESLPDHFQSSEGTALAMYHHKMLCVDLTELCPSTEHLLSVLKHRASYKGQQQPTWLLLPFLERPSAWLWRSTKALLPESCPLKEFSPDYHAVRLACKINGVRY